jgi:glycosyltransferase involved in cell wall biosynthesis
MFMLCVVGQPRVACEAETSVADADRPGGAPAPVIGDVAQVSWRRAANEAAMKIVSVMTTDSRGGAEFAAVEALEALRQRGHETVMLTDAPLIGRDTEVEIRPISIGPKLSTGSWLGLAARLPLLLARLRGALRAEAPYDVLMVHYKKEQLLARLLPKGLRRTVVWEEWGPVPFPLRKGLPRSAYLAAGRDAALVMAVSEGTRKSVVEVGVDPEKVIVVPNVLRTEEIRFTAEGRSRVRRELDIPEDAFVVGCISRFHPKKRNDVVVEAVCAMRDQRVHLILAGDGETEPQLRALAAPLGSRAHFIATPGSEVPDVLSAFDVSVFCPSPTEGAPRAVILAMLASRPCLSTGAEGVSDMITPEIGAIAPIENDPDSLRPLLERYLEDPERIQRDGAAARSLAERTYAAPIVARQIEELLSEATARAGASVLPGS